MDVCDIILNAQADAPSPVLLLRNPSILALVAYAPAVEVISEYPSNALLNKATSVVHTHLLESTNVTMLRLSAALGRLRVVFPVDRETTVLRKLATALQKAIGDNEATARDVLEESVNNLATTMFSLNKRLRALDPKNIKLESMLSSHFVQPCDMYLGFASN